MDGLINNIFAISGGSAGGNLLKASLQGTKKLGNFYQFLVDEFKNAMYVVWLGYSGACILILICLAKPTCPDGGNLENLFPSDIDEAPYCARKEDVAKLSLFKYITSFESDFPYSLRSGLPRLDPYISFFMGMAVFLFSCGRMFIKFICKWIHSKLNWTIVDVLTFYVLPTALYYIVLIGIVPIFSFFGPNLFSCFTQAHAKFAYLIAFQAFVNPFLFPVIDMYLLYNLFFYIIYIIGGFIFTFQVVPSVSWGLAFIFGFYISLLINLLPLFLVYGAGMTWTEFFNQLLSKMSKHWTGLCILFLYFTIDIGYRNLDKNIAFGMYIGVIISIVYLLNIFGAVKAFAMKAMGNKEE